MNSISLMGRLTRDPEVRYSANTQLANARFSVAVDRRLSKEKRMEAENNNQPTADFINCVAFGRTPEVQEISTIYTDISKTNYINTTNNILSINKDLDDVDRLIDKIKNQINLYEELYKKAYEEMLKIIRNTLSTKSDIVVSGISVPFSKYFERFKLLKKAHFQYALNCYFRNIDRIVNFKSYILSLLYSSIDKVGLICKEKMPNVKLLSRDSVYSEVIDDFFKKKSFLAKKEKNKKVDKDDIFERLAKREKNSSIIYAFA